MIGLGYYGTVTPPVIQRTVLENPAWYTAYTPYQPEISQGRLEALINFQTMVADLTGLDVAGASMLDEATAAAEAMTLVRRAGPGEGGRRLRRRRRHAAADPRRAARPAPSRWASALHVTDLSGGWPTDLPEAGAFGVLLSYPGASGAVRDHRALAAAAHEAGASVVVAADLLALTLLEAPGEWGADVACGTTQRFGVPMGYGGPHAGYLSVREGLARQLPGRLVGVSRRRRRRRRLPAGAADPRAAHPPREGDQQHLHRAGAARRHGRRVRRLPRPRGPGRDRGPGAPQRHRAGRLAARRRAGARARALLRHPRRCAVPGRAAEVVAAAAERRINLRLVDADTVAVACDETTTPAILRAVAEAFGVAVDDDARWTTTAPTRCRPTCAAGRRT